MKAIKSLANTFFIYLLLLIFFAIAIPTLFWVYDHYETLTVETARLEMEYADSQRALVKRHVDEVVEFVAFKKSQVEERVRKDLKMRVNEAYSIAAHLYELNLGRLPESELKTLIIEALRPLRFNKGRGYYFATAFDGTEMLFADRPELEGKNLIGMQDTQGKYVIREMIDLARNTGEGFIEYTWTKPKVEGRSYPKIAFVKHFEPFDWFIGTGEYLDDVDRELKEEALERIGQIRFGTDGYVFVMDYDSIMLSHILSKYIGQSMVGVTAPDGFKINEELVKAANKEGGDFLSYTWHKPSADKYVEKISFARGFEPWRWVVATGVYLDDVEQMIASIRGQARDRLVRELGVILLVFCVLMFLSFLLVRYISQRVHKEFRVFYTFFERSAAESQLIDESVLTFSEFKPLADSANKMIAERKKIEAETERTEKRYRQLFRDIRDGLLVTSKDGDIIDVNQATLDFLGYSRDEFMALRAVDIYSDPDEQQKILSILENWGTVTNYEITLQGKDKIPVDCLLSAAARRNNEGEIIGYHGIFRDVTEQKKMAERMQQRQKLEAIGTLAGGIAHDFNNILFVISGFAELGRLDAEEGCELDQNLQQIITSVNRASDLIRQILAFSRQAPQELRPIEIGKEVLEAVKLLRATIPTTIAIETDIRSRAMVLGDQTQIHQIIMNLGTNAWQAMREDGKGIMSFSLTDMELPNASLSLGRDLPAGFFVHLSVRDTGHGIAPEIRERIFDPYFSTRKSGDGSGLGLAMVHGIVDNHGGAVAVESTVGHGAAFNIFLPCTEAKQELEEKKASTMGLGSGRVIFVDDEVAICTMMRSILTRLGYKAQVFNDSREALREISRAPKKCDVVITDLSMPHMDGDKLAREIFAIRPDLPVILCTGHNELVVDREYANTAIREVIMKPVGVKEIGKAIRKAQVNRGASQEQKG